MEVRKVKFEEALNMSLDEYIVESGLDAIAKQLTKKTKIKKFSITSVEEFKDEGGNKCYDEAIHNNNLMDLRSKINSKQQTKQFENCNLNDDKNLEISTENIKINNVQNNFKNENKWNNFFNRKKKNKKFQNNGVKKNNYRNKKGGPFFRNNPLSVNTGKMKTGMDLTVETLFDDVSIKNPERSIMENINVDPFQFKTNDLSETSSQKSLIATNSINGLLKVESMSSLANKLLELIQGGKTSNDDETKKYDLHVQKEIHAIQGKPMIYKCPGGEVISSDGPGLNVPMQPTSTGITLNQRFA